jgi:hypothetical protein
MNVATKAPAIPSDEAGEKADYRDPDDARHDDLSNSAQAN